MLRVVFLLPIFLACSSSPPPKLPGDPCREGCPDGLRCETSMEAYQRYGKRRGAPIKTRAECILGPGRCVAAGDCSEKWMECKHSGIAADDIGFCIEPALTTSGQ